MIDEIIQHKPRLVLLNKADMADKERTKEWIQYFAQKEVKALASPPLHRKGRSKILMKKTAKSEVLLG